MVGSVAGEAPPLAVGHLALNVADLEASHQFYTGLGLRSFAKDGGIAILELRGGTHLLLFPRQGDAAAKPASVDLMIAGKTREALEAFRRGAIARGVGLGPIADERRFGHYLISDKDPDGNEVTIFTSHAGDLPV
jgi:catechol 2,3-dioxygenase-like lactoylglutathione lyase family enzyme